MGEYTKRSAVKCTECDRLGPHGPSQKWARHYAHRDGWETYTTDLPGEQCASTAVDEFLCPKCRAKAEEPEPLQACATCDHGSMGTRYRKPDEGPCRSGGVRSRGCTTWVAIGEGEDLPEPAICTQCAHHKMRGKDQAHPWCFHPVNTGKSDFDHTVGALICYKLNNDGKCPDFEPSQKPALPPLPPDVQVAWFDSWEKWVGEAHEFLSSLEKIEERVQALENPPRLSCGGCDSYATSGTSHQLGLKP